MAPVALRTWNQSVVDLVLIVSLPRANFPLLGLYATEVVRGDLMSLIGMIERTAGTTFLGY